MEGKPPHISSRSIRVENKPSDQPKVTHAENWGREKAPTCDLQARVTSAARANRKSGIGDVMGCFFQPCMDVFVGDYGGRSGGVRIVPLVDLSGIELGMSRISLSIFLVYYAVSADNQTTKLRKSDDGGIENRMFLFFCGMGI
jgi:hypothetical protein